jgi:capsule polysaccharide export protein KpsE/RkpR
MKVAAAILSQWHRENPDRLLQAALWQAERLAQMAPEVEALRAQNTSLQLQLEAKTKRIAQLEEALEAAERAAQHSAGVPSYDTAEDLRSYLCAMRSECPLHSSSANVTCDRCRRRPARTPSPGPSR